MTRTRRRGPARQAARQGTDSGGSRPGQVGGRAPSSPTLGPQPPGGPATTGGGDRGRRAGPSGRAHSPFAAPSACGGRPLSGPSPRAPPPHCRSPLLAGPRRRGLPPPHGRPQPHGHPDRGAGPPNSDAASAHACAQAQRRRPVPRRRHARATPPRTRVSWQGLGAQVGGLGVGGLGSGTWAVGVKNLGSRSPHRLEARLAVRWHPLSLTPGLPRFPPPRGWAGRGRASGDSTRLGFHN